MEILNVKHENLTIKDVSITAIVGMNPISRYNFFIDQYNNEANVVKDIHLKKIPYNCLLSFLFDIYIYFFRLLLYLFGLAKTACCTSTKRESIYDCLCSIFWAYLFFASQLAVIVLILYYIIEFPEICQICLLVHSVFFIQIIYGLCYRSGNHKILPKEEQFSNMIYCSEYCKEANLMN